MSVRSKVILLSLCAAVLLSATIYYTKGITHPAAYTQAEPSTITAEELQTRLKTNTGILLIDVRQQEEYDAGHIDGAKLIPLNILPDHVGELPKDGEIVVYCKSGRRSAQAMTFLQAQGYKNVVSLSGGYQSWVSLK